MSKYNLISPDGRGSVTEHVECLPSAESLEAMLKGGFKFYIDGKKLTRNEAIEFISQAKGKK